MLISLYSSRLLLRELGVDDFGIYGIVGGIVTMFASLKTMFSEATQRYLNIELGKKDQLELNKTFSISVYVNLIIILIFILIVEVGGLWLLNNKLVIPQERISAAFVVFHLSVMSSALAIFNVPFDADIIAHERMNVFAYVSIFDAVAKLVIILLLPVLGCDKLIIYGTLMLGVMICNLLVNAIYCLRHFSESRIRFFDIGEIKTKFKEMFVFSGWSFFGNVAFALANEGMNVLLNMFGGTVANAARTIAYQVRGAIFGLTQNVYTAVKPQAIQAYAKDEMRRYYNLSLTGGKIVGYMFLLLAVPIYFGLNELLSIWLKDIPAHTIEFISAIFIFMYVRSAHGSIDMFFVTIGKFKHYQLTEFVILASSLVFAYLGFKYFEMPLSGAFLCMAFTEIVNLIAILILAKIIGGFEVGMFLRNLLVPYSLMAILCLVVCKFIRMLCNDFIALSDWMIFIYIAIAIIAQLTVMYILGLRKEEKELIIGILRNKVRKV